MDRTYYALVYDYRNTDSDYPEWETKTEEYDTLEEVTKARLDLLYALNPVDYDYNSIHVYRRTDVSLDSLFKTVA